MENRIQGSDVDMESPQNVSQLDISTVIRHEIIQHLHNVHNSNQLLSAIVKSTKAESYIISINSNNLLALKKINNLLDFLAQPQRYDDYMAVNLQKIDVVKFVRWMHKRICELITKPNNINFQLKMGIESLFIFTDVKRLEKILYNIISNSLQHTVRKGGNNICLSVDETDIQVKVSVRDLSGGAVDESSIFETYKNIESSGIIPPSGAGLGLAVALKHAREMGAEILFETTAGQGSKAEVSLPKNLGLASERLPIKDAAALFEPDDFLILACFSDVFENEEDS